MVLLRPETGSQTALAVDFTFTFFSPRLFTVVFCPATVLVVRTTHPFGSMRAPLCPSRFTTLQVGLGGILYLYVDVS